MAAVFDTSIISNMEQWIVDRIAALSVLDTDHVQLMRGVRDLEGLEDRESYIEGERTPNVLVSWQRSVRQPTTEGDRDRLHFVSVWVSVQNPRPAASRVGESASEPGTNLLQEMIEATLDNPGDTGVTPTDRFEVDDVKVMETQETYQPGGKSTVEIVLQFRAVPR